MSLLMLGGATALLEGPAYLVAGYPREVPVQQQDVVCRDLGFVEPVGSVVGDVDGMAGAAQPDGDGLGHDVFVFDDEDSCHFYSRVLGPQYAGGSVQRR